MQAWFHSWIDWLKGLFWSKEIEITVVGLQNSGKTSLVNVLSGGSFAEEMTPTIGFNMRKVKKGQVTIRFWDVGGQPRFRTMWSRYCRGVTAILFMVDSSDLDKIQDAKHELWSLLERPELADVPVLVLGNKSDLPESLKVTELIEQLDLGKITTREISAYSISVANGSNIAQVITWLTKKS